MTDRIKTLQQDLPQDVDAVIIQSDENRYYFTGLRSSSGTLLITRTESYFIVDFRYIELARATIKGVEVILQDKFYEQIAEVFKKHSVKNVAVETTYMTVGRLTKTQNMLKDVNISTNSVVDSMILDMRAHKDATELAYIKKAQEITDTTFNYILGVIKSGLTERQLAMEIENAMMRLGAEKTSFDTICVAGANGSLPHGVPSEKKLQVGEFVTMDFGCKVGGYCSDMTRTVAIGKVSSEMEKVYGIVLEAHRRAAALIAPGVPNEDIDKEARNYIYANGYEGYFGHGTGHSLGLEIHEEPRYSSKSYGDCEVGNVMTVEPGIYIPEKFGLRIENMYLVTPNGSECLTKSPLELIVVE